MTEPSIQEAALQAAEPDWKARAEREAVAILAETMPLHSASDLRYDHLVSLMAVAWLQGVDYGAHETLHAVERGRERVQAAL